MPKLWTATIEGHRREVRDAILDSAAALVAQRGALSVTMSEIAQETGIGRATLYKYFGDVESILLAWHERHIAGHLAHLSELAAGDSSAIGRLTLVLEAYATIARQRAASKLAAILQRDEHVTRAEAGLVALLETLLDDAAQQNSVRNDIHPRELAQYCMHALNAAGAARSKAAARRVVDLTLEALDPGRQSAAANSLRRD